MVRFAPPSEPEDKTIVAAQLPPDQEMPDGRDRVSNKTSGAAEVRAANGT